MEDNSGGAGRPKSRADSSKEEEHGDCENRVGEFKVKVEPLEFVDYGEYTETEFGAINDFNFDNNDEVEVPMFLEDASFGEEIDKVGVEGNNNFPPNKRKRSDVEYESSSDEDTSSEEEDEGESKNKKKPRWEAEPSGMSKFDFESKNKILVPPPGRNNPMDWFNLLFEEDFLIRMVEATNECAEKIMADPTTHSSSRIYKWTQVSPSELRIFIGILYHMGTVKMSRIQNYWRTDEMFDFRYVRSRMTRVRFFHILKCLSVPIRNKIGDPGQVEEIIGRFNETMERVYYPGKDLVLEEGVPLWNGRRHFQGENKKEGFRLYTLSEPTGPVLKFSVRYRCESGLTRISRELMTGKDSGHSVVVNCENFGFDVAKQLLDMTTHCTGYLRPESKSIPAALKSTKVARGRTSTLYAEGVMAGKWKYKTPEIYFMCTEYSNVMVEQPRVINRGCRNTLEVPLSIQKLRGKTSRHSEWNDHLTDFYPIFNQKCLLWSKRLFIHLLQAIMYNSFKLFQFANATNDKREHMEIHDFRIQVIEKLLEREDVAKPWKPFGLKNSPQDTTESFHTLSKYPTLESRKRSARRRCKQCLKDGIKEKKTIYYCAQCPGLPGLCPINCFDKYHLVRRRDDRH